MDRLLKKHGEYTAGRDVEAIKIVAVRENGALSERLFWRKAD